MMDLDNSNRGLPSYVDNSDDGEIQRDAALHLIREEKTIKTDMETDVAKFNDITAMEQFNDSFNSAIEHYKSMHDEAPNPGFRR